MIGMAFGSVKFEVRSAKYEGMSIGFHPSPFTLHPSPFSLLSSLFKPPRLLAWFARPSESCNCPVNIGYRPRRHDERLGRHERREARGVRPEENTQACRLTPQAYSHPHHRQVTRHHCHSTVPEKVPRRRTRARRRQLGGCRPAATQSDRTLTTWLRFILSKLTVAFPISVNATIMVPSMVQSK